MRQSITTYFLAPTNVRGSRIKARASGGTSVTLHWDHAMNADATTVCRCFVEAQSSTEQPADDNVSIADN